MLPTLKFLYHFIIICNFFLGFSLSTIMMVVSSFISQLPAGLLRIFPSFQPVSVSQFFLCSFPQFLHSYFITNDLLHAFDET